MSRCPNCTTEFIGEPTADGRRKCRECGTVWRQNDLLTITLPRSILEAAYTDILDLTPRNLFDEDTALDVLHNAVGFALEPPEQIGHCDTCYAPYDTASQIDHCSEEGLCWAHCSDREQHEP